MTGCEAPLMLDRVDIESSKYTHRTDSYQASAINNKVAVIVGSNGVILTSTDQGDSWSRAQLTQKPNIIDVANCQDGSFIALTIEGDVWLSEDDAKSWKQRKIESEEVPQAMDCGPDNRIWVVGSFGTILESDDKGVSWLSHSLDDDLILTFVHFHDAQNGIIAGEFGTVLVTEDGGKNWQKKTVIHEEFIPLGSYFIDARHGWVAGLGGVIYYTNDGADSWVKESTNIRTPLFNVMKINSSIYAVGQSGISIMRSINDDGSSGGWEKVKFEPTASSYLRVIQSITSDKLLLGGGAGYVQVIKNDARYDGLKSQS